MFAWLPLWLVLPVWLTAGVAGHALWKRRRRATAPELVGAGACLVTLGYAHTLAYGFALTRPAGICGPRTLDDDYPLRQARADVFPPDLSCYWSDSSAYGPSPRWPPSCGSLKCRRPWGCRPRTCTTRASGGRWPLRTRHRPVTSRPPTAACCLRTSTASSPTAPRASSPSPPSDCGPAAPRSSAAVRRSGSSGLRLSRAGEAGARPRRTGRVEGRPAAVTPVRASSPRPPPVRAPAWSDWDAPPVPGRSGNAPAHR
ncbi:hypothetical protein SUDANB145_00144 [Streptomyces sp. enrichment culture]